MLVSAKTRLAKESIVKLPAVFEMVAAVPERERVASPELAPRVIVPSAAFDTVSAFRREISLVNVPEKLTPVANVPPTVSTKLIPFDIFPAEFVISMASVIPAAPAESIFTALSTAMKFPVAVSSC